MAFRLTRCMAAPKQAQHRPEPSAADRLRRQRGLLPLAARFLILHSAKLVALALFAAAMQLPGALGWALTGACAV